jgi:hypothetical protein
MFAITAIASEAMFERASRKGTPRIFRAVLGLRLLFGFCIPTALYGASRVWAAGDIFTAGIFVAMAAGMFIFWPGTIILDENSARREKWFGLKKTKSPWSEVSYVGPDREGSITIRARDGRSIEHTKYHVDPTAYSNALKRYVKHSMPAETRIEWQAEWWGFSASTISSELKAKSWEVGLSECGLFGRAATLGRQVEAKTFPVNRARPQMESFLPLVAATVNGGKDLVNPTNCTGKLKTNLFYLFS